jgi:hypothetical protein
MPNTEIRTEFLLIKNKSNSWNFKQSVIAGLPTLSAGYNYMDRVTNALE